MCVLIQSRRQENGLILARVRKSENGSLRADDDKVLHYLIADDQDFHPLTAVADVFFWIYYRASSSLDRQCASSCDLRLIWFGWNDKHSLLHGHEVESGRFGIEWFDLRFGKSSESISLKEADHSPRCAFIGLTD
jgi:hypothetical protein